MSTAKRKKRSSSLKGSLNPSKRHRDRFNIELDNLAKLLPFPHDVIQKLDKLSILRLSASYLRAKNFFKGQHWNEEGANSATKLVDKNSEFPTEGNGVFSKLLLDALDGFVIVLTQECEVFYASETIQEYLGLSQASVIHQDFLRFIHVDDHDQIKKYLKPFPEDDEEQKIKILDEENDGPDSAMSSQDDGGAKDRKIETERAFGCRMKCILNTSAGFFKPFRCTGRLREMTLPESEKREYGLFLICTPLETMHTSILEIRIGKSLFCTKNRMDLSFMDIDQKGRSLLGYHKRDIALQSSYCMIHFDDIIVLQDLHRDLMGTGKCQGTFRMLNKNLKWQWLTGTAQVVFKGNEPDFIITTNRPLSDEEGEEILRQRGQLPALPFATGNGDYAYPKSIREVDGSATNGSTKRAFSWENFSANNTGFKYPGTPPQGKYGGNGRTNKRRSNGNLPEGSREAMNQSPTDSQEEPFSRQPGSPFLDDALTSTSCTSAPMSPSLLDLGVDLQVDLDNDVPDLKFLDSQDLCFDGIPLDSLEPRENREDLVQSMSLLAVKLPTYEEALHLANECLSGSSESTSVTSPDSSQISMTQSSPRGLCDPYSPGGNLSHGSYPSPTGSHLSHSSTYVSPNTIPTPDPSPLGHPEPERASVNISWQGVGQMKVSPQPQMPMSPPQPLQHQHQQQIRQQQHQQQQHQHQQQQHQHQQQQQQRQQHHQQQQQRQQQQQHRPPFPPMHMQQQQANMGGINFSHHLSKSALAASMIKKQERGDYGSCLSTPGMLPQQNWGPPNQQVMSQPCDYKNMPLNHGTFPTGPDGMSVVPHSNSAPMQSIGGNTWDPMAVPPLFEDTLPSIEVGNAVQSMDTVNRQGMMQNGYQWGQQQDMLSPPYQEDQFAAGFGFQGNPVPVTKDGW